MSEVLIAFKDAAGAQRVVSAANPLPTSGGAVSDPTSDTQSVALLTEVRDRITELRNLIGTPNDAVGAHTVIGLLRQIAKNTHHGHH